MTTTPKIEMETTTMPRTKNPATEAKFDAALELSPHRSFQNWLEAANVSRGTFYNARSGRITPNVADAIRIATAVGLTVEGLFGHLAEVKRIRYTGKTKTKEGITA